MTAKGSAPSAHPVGTPLGGAVISNQIFDWPDLNHEPHVQHANHWATAHPIVQIDR